MTRTTILILGLICGQIGAAPAAADKIHCAVSANFMGCLEEIASAFEDSTGHTLVLSPGSTGAHYAQIRQGAPFHIYFAADDLRPARLEEKGHAAPGTRATYALGRLVLWAPRIPPEGNPDPAAILNDPAVRTVAMADPRLAPYGRAARQVLDHLEYEGDDIVTGRNVGQTWQFVASGAADVGFVALSQVRTGRSGEGLRVTVPAELHDPIEQQVVILREGDGPAVRALLAFVTGPVGRAIIAEHGYGLPSGEKSP